MSDFVAGADVQSLWYRLDSFVERASFTLVESKMEVVVVRVCHGRRRAL
jgi:hypothetical protein